MEESHELQQDDAEDARHRSDHEAADETRANHSPTPSAIGDSDGGGGRWRHIETDNQCREMSLGGR